MPTPDRILLIAAAPQEARGVLRAFDAENAPMPDAWRASELDARFDLVLGGVGKANGAGALVRTLDPARHTGVMSVGICGSLPGGPGVGSCVLASRSVYADEGLVTSGGFETCEQMGFPLGGGIDAGAALSPEWAGWLTPLADVVAPIATVSTCSGTDELAAEVARRTGAAAEAMEGAAIAQALGRTAPGVAFAELRTVSNHTGERSRQAWDIDGALSRLSEVLGRARGNA